LIAIPALSVYGIFRNHIEAIVNEAASEGEDALIKIRSGLENSRRFDEVKRKQESTPANKIVGIEPKTSGAIRQPMSAQQ